MALAARDGLGSRGLVQARDLGRVPAERGERDPRPGRALAADRLVHRVLLDDMRRDGGEIAGEQLPADAQRGRHRQQREHPGVAYELEDPVADGVPRVVVPDPDGHPAGEPQPVQLLLARRRRRRKGASALRVAAAPAA